MGSYSGGTICFGGSFCQAWELYCLLLELMMVTLLIPLLLKSLMVCVWLPNVF